MFKRLFSRRKLINQTRINAANQRMTNNITTSVTSPSTTITVPSTSSCGTYSINAGTTSAILTGPSVYQNSVTFSPPTTTFTLGSITSSSVISFHNNTTEIVRLNKDGSVTWRGEIDINEAAEAFAKSLTVGSEMLAGITQGTKTRMRDSVFNDIIAIAREKGSLTADDLTYMLEASKIVEKLKGGDE